MSPAGVVAALSAATLVVAVQRAVGLTAVIRGRRRTRALAGVRPSAIAFNPSQSRAPNPKSWLVVPARLERAILATAIPLDPRTAVAGWAAAVVAVTVLGGQVGGSPTAVIGALVVLIGGLVLLRINRNRRQDCSDRALPELLESVARSLRSGGSLTQAVLGATETVSGTPLADDLRPLVVTVERGAPLVVAFDQWAQRATTAPKILAARALSLVAETGGAPGPLVDAVAQTLRDRDRIEREARALSTQARASAVVVAVAPLAFTAVAAMADPNIGTFLFRSPLGLGCLTVGLFAEGVGAWWMSHLAGAGR